MCTPARRCRRTFCRWSPRACSCQPRCACCAAQPKAAFTGILPFYLTFFQSITFCQAARVTILQEKRHCPASG
jgi:hypothetical protein